jgi:hypothetical protein
MKTSALFLAAGIVGWWCGLGIAQTTTALNAEATKMNTLASSQGDSKVVDKISSDFSSFLGADSKAVVTGLRNGTPITLTSTAPTSTTGTTAVTTTNTTIINPPTGKMGHGNVFISLALAKQQLGAVGITEPTPQQLQAALTGGSITTTGTTATGTPTTTTTPLKGILTMRSQDMGWGQIAHELGYKLGPVISSMKHTNQNITTTTSTTANVKGNGQVNRSPQSGIVSAGGQSHGNSNHGISNSKGSGSGIVTGSGKGSGNGYAYGNDRGNIVTGSGQSGSSRGIVSGGGNASGHGKGHNK